MEFSSESNLTQISDSDCQQENSNDPFVFTKTIISNF